MKLYEIENYLEKKVRFKDHDEGFYIYFEKGYWLKSTGKHFYMSPIEVEYGNWEEYIESEAPKVKRLWKFIKKNGGYQETVSYYDDNDVKDWKVAVKVVDRWIEIDQNGELINWAGKE